MRVGLIDVDGHNYPNLALMRLSSYHKAKGDLVEWWCKNRKIFNEIPDFKNFDPKKG